MDFVAALLPLLAVGASALAGRPAWFSACAAAIALAVGMLWRFPTDPLPLATHLLGWLPLVLEILLILLGGVFLARLTEAAGHQDAIASWLGTAAGTPLVTVLAIVHGITPFAESVMGFGVGAMIGVPLLLRAGLPPHRAAVVGLLGLTTVPWGAMGPGTVVAARLAGLDVDALGVASARLNGVAFVGCGVSAVLVGFGRVAGVRGVAAGVGSGLLLWAGVGFANLAFGMPPAGAMGSVATMAVLLLVGRLRHRTAAVAHPPPWRALAPFALLLGGVLAARLVTHAVDGPAHLLASPAGWMGLAALAEYAGLRRARGPADGRRAAVRAAGTLWWAVAPATGLFVLIGVAMVHTGMAASIAEAAARLGATYALGVPLVGAAGGFLTGSNSGANAMFAASQTAAAHALGRSTSGFVAAQNVAASLLTAASPGRVHMAVRLCPPGSVTARRTTLAVLAVEAGIVAVWSALLAAGIA